VIVRLHPGVGEELNECTRLSCLLGGPVKFLYVKAHHMAHEIAEVTSRIGVVADVRDSLRGEHVLANLEDALANTLRDPGIDAVSDNKRELSILVQAWIAKIHGQKS